MGTIDIIALCFIGIILIIGAALAIKKFWLCPPEQKKELIINWLTGAVVNAQNLIIEKTDEANKEKFNQVLNQFKANAPWLYKLFIKFSKDLQLESLIEQALTNIKNTKF